MKKKMMPPLALLWLGALSGLFTAGWLVVAGYRWATGQPMMGGGAAADG